MKKIFLSVFAMITINTCFSLPEKSVWDRVFERFLSENLYQTVLYATLTYSGIGRETPFKVIFVYKLSEPKGAVIFTDGKMIINYFEVSYSVETNRISYDDIMGGLWEHEEAHQLLDIVSKTNLKMITCKDLMQIALPSDGILKF